MGRIIIMLSPKDAPKTVENFLRYVEDGYYNNTVFHRVIIEKKKTNDEKDTSMNIVQGGGYTFPLRLKPTRAPIVNEAGRSLQNKRGTISMARTDNPDSATSQFFFNVQDNPVLDQKSSGSQTGAALFSSTTKPGYCAFGKVIRGMDVVDKIQQVKTARSGRMEDVPATPIYIKKAYVAK
ncbi:peptidylprolyl isomerase [Pseudodesulfovibrio sediminis]|uniref:Peptidyl-prolyl cis-trans isomerase n=1 Tax=Pseudodesulfovibrio sediminis TaxID=2810563 RepID=A0ABN6ETB1_9BACT|nr:peptidylprolyl isomerase [Pseudodesulfovibrio sediminis]BCS88683.1 peptidyl-prolyl cis-trans isomerase B [Pseudodesulfovibrio sediminis]